MKIDNYSIKANSCGGWIVKGDTERFGVQQILFESPFFNECVEYLEKNDCVYSVETEIDKVRDVQIAYRMFHRIRRENGKLVGYNNKWGWEELNIEGFELFEPLKAKRTRIDGGGYKHNETLKLGTACTW